MLRYREEGGFFRPNLFPNNNPMDPFHRQHLKCISSANETEIDLSKATLK
jgi:hypothetical protein